MKELEFKGFKVYSERVFDLPNYKKTKRGNNSKIRVDIVACDQENNIKFFVEVKNHLNKKTPTNTRQYAKYSSLGIPFYFCFDKKDLEKILK